MYTPTIHTHTISTVTHTNGTITTDSSNFTETITDTPPTINEVACRALYPTGIETTLISMPAILTMINDIDEQGQSTARIITEIELNQEHTPEATTGFLYHSS